MGEKRGKRKEKKEGILEEGGERGRWVKGIREMKKRERGEDC